MLLSSQSGKRFHAARLFPAIVPDAVLEICFASFSAWQLARGALEDEVSTAA
jgi:hypothetical protein